MTESISLKIAEDTITVGYDENIQQSIITLWMEKK